MIQFDKRRPLFQHGVGWKNPYRHPNSQDLSIYIQVSALADNDCWTDNVCWCFVSKNTDINHEIDAFI